MQLKTDETEKEIMKSEKKLDTLFKNKRLVFLLAISLVLFVMLVVLAISLIPKYSQKPDEANQGQPHDAASGAIRSSDPITKEKDRRSALVIQMGQLLPYRGTNFSLYYSYSDDSFTLYINPSATEAGNKELNDFLAKNKVKKEWIENLKTTNSNVSPAP